MGELIDANVLLRTLLNDISHPDYDVAVQHLVHGGAVRDYVVPEVVFIFTTNERKRRAREYAVSCGELLLFDRNPRKYTQNVEAPSGWKQEAYVAFSISVSELLSQYPNVEIDNYPLFKEALSIACATGYDWVDCMLLAEKRVNGHNILSLDADVTNPKDERNSKSKSPLGGLHLK